MFKILKKGSQLSIVIADKLTNIMNPLKLGQYTDFIMACIIRLIGVTMV